MPACAYCNSIIPWGEGLCEDGKWYEEKCYMQKLHKRKIELEKKYPVLKDMKNPSARNLSGKMSVDEAKEYQDIIIILTNLINPEKLPSTHNRKPLPKKELKDFFINKVRFGARVDTERMISSGEIRKVAELNPENGRPMFLLCEDSKPQMKAVFCPPPENIIPYTETQRIEGENRGRKQISVISHHVEKKRKNNKRR